MANTAHPNAMSICHSPMTPAKARLSDQQKKDNHISSEKKRREAIRSGFDKLSTLVPGMEGQARSEAIVLGATVNFMQDEIARKKTVAQLALSMGWTQERIDRVYSDFENSLRASDATGAMQPQAQTNGQGQFQNSFPAMPMQHQQAQSQPAGLHQHMPPPTQPPALQQQQTNIPVRPESPSQSKSMSPCGSPADD